MAAFAGTVTVNVFHAPGVICATVFVWPVHAQPPAAPCCTNAWTALIALFAGIQTRYVTVCPAPGNGLAVDQMADGEDDPDRFTASDRCPAYARAVAEDRPVMRPPGLKDQP